MMFDYSSTHICVVLVACMLFFWQYPNIDQLVYVRSQAHMMAILFVFLYDEIAHSAYLRCCKYHFALYDVLCDIIGIPNCI